MNNETSLVNNKPTFKPLPMYKVIVHNDDVNTYNHVIGTFMEIIKMDKQTALLKTVEVDKEGMSVVSVTHKEHAELLQDQLKSKALTVTIEPD
jgi:ATP-dependent Clp protease adaptor protein ClpS